MSLRSRFEHLYDNTNLDDVYTEEQYDVLDDDYDSEYSVEDYADDLDINNYSNGSSLVTFVDGLTALSYYDLAPEEQMEIDYMVNCICTESYDPIFDEVDHSAYLSQEGIFGTVFNGLKTFLKWVWRVLTWAPRTLYKKAKALVRARKWKELRKVADNEAKNVASDVKVINAGLTKSADKVAKNATDSATKAAAKQVKNASAKVTKDVDDLAKSKLNDTVKATSDTAEKAVKDVMVQTRKKMAEEGVKPSARIDVIEKATENVITTLAKGTSKAGKTTKANVSKGKGKGKKAS